MRDLSLLTDEDIKFIDEKAEQYRFSFQDKKKVSEIADDLRRWDEGNITSFWPAEENSKLKGKDLRKHIMNSLITGWDILKKSDKEYENFESGYQPEKRISVLSDTPAENPIMGTCPVASEKTRCCNLRTLDAVMNCGFDCSYCSIQTFYHTREIKFHTDLRQKLSIISDSLSPDQRYHIGTGQSSDSLMWGNHQGMMEHLFDFAETNPNVILELKSKSDNIDYLRGHRIPPNVVTTWSLNPEVIIDKEEHLAASLKRRLAAAEAVSSAGGLVGFHFHPMVMYKGWQEGYSYIFSELLKRFNADDVCMVSMGTLTFIKPVMRELKRRMFKSKILQMPMTEIAGKFSYPFEVKAELFRFAYEALKPWHDSVFFYMCMEDIALWEPVFGRTYSTNENFEEDMISSYFKKIESKWKKQ